MKKLLLLLAVLMLALSARASTALNLTDTLLISDDGELLTEKGAYSRILPLCGDLYGAVDAASGLTRILNGKGEIVSARDYNRVSCAGGRVILTAGTYCALYDESLNQLTPFTYRLIVPGEDGGFLAFKTDIWDGSADRVYYLDADGVEYPTQNTILYAFRLEDGLPAPVPEGRSGLTGYLTGWGEWMIPAEYLSAGVFRGSLASASVKEGTGVIDRDGDWILSPVYDSVILSDQFVCAVKGGRRQVYRVDGSSLTPLYSGPSGVSLLAKGFVLYSDEAACLMDGTGALNARFGADTILYSGIGNGIIVSEYEGMYLYDMATRMTSDGFLALTPLGEDLYKTCSDTGEEEGHPFHFGVMDGTGHELLKTVYEAVQYCGSGLIAAQAGDTIFLFRISGGEAEELYRFE